MPNAGSYGPSGDAACTPAFLPESKLPVGSPTACMCDRECTPGLAAPPSDENPPCELGRGLLPRRHHAAADRNSMECTHARRPSATAVSTRTGGDAATTAGILSRFDLNANERLDFGEFSLLLRELREFQATVVRAQEHPEDTAKVARTIGLPPGIGQRRM